MQTAGVGRPVGWGSLELCRGPADLHPSGSLSCPGPHNLAVSAGERKEDLEGTASTHPLLWEGTPARTTSRREPGVGWKRAGGGRGPVCVAHLAECSLRQGSQFTTSSPDAFPFLRISYAVCLGHSH